MKLMIADSFLPCSHSPRHSEARLKDVGVILAFGDLGSKRMPYVLVTGNQSDRRRDLKIVEDLNAAFVARSGSSQCKLRDVRLQIATDPVVVESHSETIVFSSAEEALRNQRDTRVAGNGVRKLWAISSPTKDSNPTDRLTTLQLLGSRRGVVHDVKILRKISNGDPAFILKIGRQTFEQG